MSDVHTKQFPTALHGTYKEVRTRWRKLVSAAIQSGSWEPVHKDSEFAPIDSLSGYIVMSRSHRPAPGVHLHANLIWDELYEVTSKKFSDRDAWFQCIRDLTLKGIEEYWFCLGVVGKGSHWLPGGSSFDTPDDRKRIAATVLRQVVKWWPQLVEDQPRFASTFLMPWPWWCASIVSVASDLDLPEEEIQKLADDQIDSARARIQNWIETSEGVS